MPEQQLAERVVEIAQRWAVEGAAAEKSPAAERLSAVLRDERGPEFVLELIDGILRPQSLGAAAASLRRAASVAPDTLPWYARSAVRAGAAAAPVAPAAIVPPTRVVLRELLGHLVIDGREAKLAPALQKLHDDGFQVNLRLCDPAAHGEHQAHRHLARLTDLVARDDVDAVTFALSSVISRRSLWAFDDLVDDLAQRLTAVYLAAAEHDTMLILDAVGYSDLDLTIAVFTRILENPRLAQCPAGIVLQTVFPDSWSALHELTAWAADRVAHGGAPITIRLSACAYQPAEQVHAALHGWPSAAAETTLDADAQTLRCLDAALHPDHTDAVRITLAGAPLPTIAYAWSLADERGVAEALTIDLPVGIAPGTARALARELPAVTLTAPVVEPAELDGALGYLTHLIGAASTPEAQYSTTFHDSADPELLAAQHQRHDAAMRRAQDAALPRTPLRTQNRQHADEPIQRSEPVASETESDLTNTVLGIARGSSGAVFTETAVYSGLEDAARTPGAPGFQNTAPSDPALAVNRAWAASVRAQLAHSTAGDDTLRVNRIDDRDVLERTLDRVRSGGWGQYPASERSEVLVRAASVLQQRRATLIEVAGAEGGVLFSDADAEVNSAVDAAAYYAVTARELDAIAGATFVPARLTLVTPAAASPIAGAAAEVLAALAAGSGVVLAPHPHGCRTAAVIAETLWDAGVPRDALALAVIDDDSLAEALLGHTSVDRVLFSGTAERAAEVRAAHPQRPVIGTTGGANAMIVMPSADRDQAIDDLVASAFGGAGQRAAAASVAILVGAMGRSKEFARDLKDAVESLEVGWPNEAMSDIGPLHEVPSGPEDDALNLLEGEERWLVKPEPVRGDDTGRLWTPGVRVGVVAGARAHRAAHAAPVLSIMHAPTLRHALHLQNAMTDAVAAGLHTQNPHDLALWLSDVQVGSLFVNQAMTEGSVQRHPRAVWSAIGPAAAAGGPNYLIGLGSWASSPRGASSSTLHLRGLDSRISALIEAAQPSLKFDGFEWLRQAALSDAIAWDREFGQVRDVSRLGVERNLLRYRPVPVMVRATADATWHELLRVVVAAIRAGAAFVLSTPVGLPGAVRGLLSELGVFVSVESDAEWLERMSGVAPEADADADGDTDADDIDDDVDIVIGEEPHPQRVRLVGPRESVAELRLQLSETVGIDQELAVYDAEVTSAGRIELLPFVREQAITITAHRHGRPDAWSVEVI